MPTGHIFTQKQLTDKNITMKKIIAIILVFMSLQVESQQIIAYDDSTLAMVTGNDTIQFSFSQTEAEQSTRLLIKHGFKRLRSKLPKSSFLSSNFTSTSTTPSNVLPLSFNGKAGNVYRVELIADYQTAATTTGCIIGIGTNGSGNVKGFIKSAVSANAAATELAIPLRSFSGAGSSLTTTGVSAINTPHSIHLVAVIRCTADGVFGIRFGSEVEGSQAQLNTGSVLIVQEL